MSKKMLDRLSEVIIDRALQGVVGSVVTIGGKVALRTVAAVRERLAERTIRVKEKETTHPATTDEVVVETDTVVR
jgi:hypothetical protein